LAWLNRWVKGDRSVRQGPPVDLIDQNGVRYAASNYPVATRYSLGAVGSGTLALTSTGGSGPVTAQSTNTDLTGSLASSITPAAATNAVNVAIDAPSHSALVVGAPRLSVTYRGTVTDGTRPTRVFAQLVDTTTGLVLGNQITPIRVRLDGQTHTTTVPLEIVSEAVRPGQRLELQLVATTVAYVQPRLGGAIDFTDVSIKLPVASGVKVG